MSLTLVHSVPIWLPQTQTWIYNQVSRLQRLGVAAHVVCERTENLVQFPVDNIHNISRESAYLRFVETFVNRLGAHHQLNYLSRVSRQANAGIIHSHFGPTAWNNLKTVRKLKVRHLVTFYGFDVNQLLVQAPVWRSRYEQLFDEIDRVLCEGTHMADCLVSLGCPQDKVRVQHLGVDVDAIKYQPRQWHPGEPLRVLMAASFREKKGIPYGIKALAAIARNVPVQLTIIGDAGRYPDQQREKDQILSALEQSGMKDHTRLPGYLDYQTLMQEAFDHHLFLQPSVTAADGDTEGGAPVAIIEMLASGMPVLGTRHCDIPEVIGPAFFAPLAPERDVVKLTEGIQALLNAPDDWSDLASRGRKHVEENYHLDRQTECLIAHYNDVLLNQ